MKFLFLLCASFLLIACSTPNEQYYRLNPDVLQKALKQCPEKQPSGLGCEKLAAVAEEMNRLAFQLQSNPQAFGKKILALQETMAKQDANLDTASIDKNKQQLAEYLAVVKWLESPKS